MASDALMRLRDRVEEFYKSINITIKEIIIENEAFIIDMNAEIQLYERGINRLGVDISSYEPYSEVTIWIKKEKGQPYDRVTLRDEGEFEQSFFLDVRDLDFEIKAGDWKTEDLIKRYGSEILGLTDENRADVIWGYVYPGLCKKRDETILKR